MLKKPMLFALCCLFLHSCAPKVGSPEWCKNMEEKPKADWSLNDAKDYAKSCVFK